VTSSSLEKLDDTSKITVLLSVAILVWPVWAPLAAPITLMNVGKLVISLGETASKRTRKNFVCGDTYSAPGMGDRYR
jgi:hypothetical protein